MEGVRGREKHRGFMKRKTSGPSSWAGMHPQPKAFLKLASLPSLWEVASQRQERNPPGIPWPDWPELRNQLCSSAGSVQDGKNLFTYTIVHFTASHSVLLWNSHLTLLYKYGVSREFAYPLPTPKCGLTAAAYFFQINEGVCKVQDSMPWSFSWPSSLVSTLRGLPPWWPFPSLHLQLQLKLPSAFRLSSLCVFSSTSNMCKIIPQFVPWNNFSAWLPNTFSVTECRKLWVTFYIYSSLTHHSFRIRGQPQMPHGGIWPLSW